MRRPEFEPTPLFTSRWETSWLMATWDQERIAAGNRLVERGIHLQGYKVMLTTGLDGIHMARYLARAHQLAAIDGRSGCPGRGLCACTRRILALVLFIFRNVLERNGNTSFITIRNHRQNLATIV